MDDDPVTTALTEAAKKRGREAYEHGGEPPLRLPWLTELWHQGWNKAFAKDWETQ